VLDERQMSANDDAPADATGVEPIAIIGLAIRVPGASDATQFWQNLIDGRESIRFYTREEQLAIGVPAAILDQPTWVSAAPVLPHMEDFDAELFGMTRREVELMDPHHRLFLELAHTALEDSGYDPARYRGAVGVYAGAGHLRYQWLNLRRNRQFWAGAGGQLSVTVANSPDYVGTTVSYKLNLRGPSFTVQTACSTSAVALHLACEAVRNGECDMAIAGGANIELPHGVGYASAEGFTSPDGHCRPFDAAAEGTLWGSGAGVVLVKRLADALADGDHIRAVVLGNAINNDGSAKVGFSAPSVEGQAGAVAQAVAAAGIDPRTVSYVEAHGTGTAMGDPIEVAALSQVYGAATTDRQWCGIGSVKGNIGHLSQAAGIVGITKAVLSLEHGIVPPVAHYEQPNPNIDFENSPFYVVQTPSRLRGNGAPPRVGVSSFGVGGTNSHFVLEQAPAPAPRVHETAPAYALQLSAATAPALSAMAENLASHLEQHPDADLGDVAYTLRVGRAERRHRAVVIARDAADAAAALRDSHRFVPGEIAAPTRVAFLFPGQGAQYAAMGADLYRTEAVFAAAVDECMEVLGAEFRALFFDAQAGEKLRQTQWTQPALFVVEYALARLWASWGVRPAAMIGHSIGEYVAATLAGVFSVVDAVRLVSTRGRLMQSCAAGSMLAVMLDEADLLPRLSDGVALAAVNGPACVVAGETAAVEAFAAALEADGVDSRRLRTSHAFHSCMMDPILDEFQAAVAAVSRRAPSVPFLSNVTGTWITPQQAVDPVYWASHLRQPVRFSACVATLLAEKGPWSFVECGPGRQLSGLVRSQLPRDVAPPVQSLPDIANAGRKPTEAADTELGSMYAAAGSLWVAGVALDAERFGSRGGRVSLPTYPYERERYWVEPDPVEFQDREAPTDADAAALAPREWFAVPTWRPMRPSDRAVALEACVLFATGPRGEALAEALRAAGTEVTVVRTGEDYDLDEPAPARVVHAHALDGEPAGTDLDAAWRAQELGFFHALELVKAIAATSREIHLDILTSDTEDAVSGGVRRPEYSTLAGISRVAPLEVNGLTVRRIDVVARTGAGEMVAELRRPVLGSSEIAVRNGRRWSLDFAQITLDHDDPELREGGCYLITGGLGGIGITVAEDLAQRTRGVMVLLSRTDLPPRAEWDEHLARHGVVDRAGRAIAAIRRIERAGATVCVMAADVTELGDLRRVRHHVDAEGWTLAGIVHAAGMPGSGMIEVKDPAAAAAVLHSKVTGTLALQAAFGDLPLDFVVLCSSITAIVGSMGQVDYCAANAFQDAYARSLHGWPARVVSINWGRWDEVGMAAEMSTRATAGIRADQSPIASIAHPILTSRRDESVVGVVGPESHWVLDEHRIGGVSVMPGTAHLECARAALTSLVASPGDEAVVEIDELSFLEPLAVPDGGVARYRVTRDADGDFQIQDGTGRMLAEFRARWVDRQDPPVVDVAAIRERCRPVTGSRRTGVVTYGSRWDCLREAFAGEGEDLALIEAPAAAAADLDRWVLHPALLDIATSFGFSSAEGSFLPLAYGRVRVLDRLPARFYSHLRYQESDTPGLLSAAVALLDVDGRVLVEIADFTLRRVDREVVAGSVQAGPAARPAADAEGSGEESIRPADGVRALLRVLAGDVGRQVAALPIRVGTVRERVSRVSAEYHSGAAASRAGHGAGSAEAAANYVAPRSVLEERLVEVWQNVLGVARVGVEDNFFSIGGNSLVAVQLVSNLRRALKVKLPMRTVFETPTVAGLCERVQQLRAETAAEEKTPAVVGD
jgi:phthiocerol/phenolphthiocerol synthesis type-I polyketide synthase E